MSKYLMEDHSFVICAYKESEFLEECILSLLGQTKKSNILLATSTPNQHILNLVEKYNLPFYINEGKSGIAEDWNFAISMAKTKLVTVAHQDDTYEPQYAEKMVEAMNAHDKVLIAFSDYGEIRNGEKVDDNKLLRIKRFLLRGLRKKTNQVKKNKKKGALKFGSAICCPAVTINLDLVNEPVFKPHFRSNVDWQTWVALSNKEGAFSFCPQVLMHHRIHEESETSQIIKDNQRSEEDFEMFSLLWPKWIAKLITILYKLSENSNKL